MGAKLQKSIAVVMMLLSLACVFYAVMASTQRTEIQGPTAIVALPDGSVWLSVDEEMWHINADGQRVAVADAATLNLGGRIGNLVLHPNGQMAAQVRGDPTLYLLDPQTATIKSRLTPQWQPDLSKDGSDAINYAFDENGRVAIATGGGHAVALFDAEGRFLARTQPGTYEFTNGLWWSGDSLWTTDTNRMALVELDGNALAEKSRIKLLKHNGRYLFLGMATSSNGTASGTTHSLPMATLIRFANGMTKGIATDVYGDGSQQDFPSSTILEPRDIKWRDNQLLLVDNASFSIKRYSDTHMPMADFGDQQVQAELAQLLHKRQAFATQYHMYLFGAVALFALGFVFAFRAQNEEKLQTLATLKVDLAHLGTPILPTAIITKTLLKVFWPHWLFSIFIVFLGLTITQTVSVVKEAHQQIAFLLFIGISGPLLTYVAARLAQWNASRFSDKSAIEAVLNFQAVQFLKSNTAFWKARQDNEVPQEVFVLFSGNSRPVLITLTNQRLLVYLAGLRDRFLDKEYPRSEIAGIRYLEKNELTFKQKLMLLFKPGGAAINMDFRDGRWLRGIVPAAAIVERIKNHLQSTTPSMPSIDDRKQAKVNLSRAKSIPGKMAIWQTVASLLIPGLGQWMQRRSGTALIVFVVWLVVLTPVVIIGWTLWTVSAAVPINAIILNAFNYLFVCMLAASDTWIMRERVKL